MAFIAIFALTSCNQKMQQLKEQVEKFNNACPFSFGEIMTMNSVTFDNEVLVMKLTANENVVSISALNNHKEEVKEILGMSLSKDTSKDLVDAVIEAGVNYRIVIVGGQSGMRAEAEMTATELKTSKERFSNMTEGQKLIASNVMGMKIKLPLQQDEITTLTGLSLTSSALVYKFEINDAETGREMDNAINFMKYLTLSQMSQSMKNGLVGARNKQFYEALIECNQGMEFEYHEVNTGNNSSFRISTDEIREVLNGKWDNQPTAAQWNEFGKALENFANEYDGDSIQVVDSAEVYEYEEAW